MYVIPAIDLHNQKCVRLVKGDFATWEQVANDPFETVKKFSESGAEWVHVVDLDGAKVGSPVHRELILKIAKSTKIKIELGGGIRTFETVKDYIENGIDRVILGSVALKNPNLVKRCIEQFGDKIGVGIDAKNGMISTEGWLEDSSINYLTLCKTMMDIGINYIAFTDIERDGTLSGPNFDQLISLNQLAKSNYNCNIVASGGIHNIDDILICKNMGMYGCICGKAIYSGLINLEEAISICSDH